MSQGTQVKWDGGALGFVTSWEFTPGVAETMDATDYSAALGGLGAEARVWKMLDCTAITPGTASVSVLGAASGGIGDRGSLSIETAGGAVFVLGDAIIAKRTTTAAVGELIKSVIEFQFTGA